jgi:hypothetical protein
MPDPFKRNRTTLDSILLAFADRLRTIPDLNNQNVVVSDQEVPESFPTGSLCLSVSPSDGRFKLPGGGHATLNEDTEIVVGIYVVIVRDRLGRSETKLVGRKTQFSAEQTAERKPLLEWKRRVLQKLLVDDPAKGPASKQWMPVDSDGLPILRNEIYPTSSRGPLEVAGEKTWLGLHLRFAISFDWYLYA